MASTAATGLQMATVKPSVVSSRRMFTSKSPISVLELKDIAQYKLASSGRISSVQPFSMSCTPVAMNSNPFVTRAMAGDSDKGSAPGLPIDLRGKNFTLFVFPVLVTSLHSWTLLS